MVFSRDGRSLFVANSDSTILQWDVSGRHGQASAVLSPARLDELWQTLRSGADQAYPALWEMLDHPAETVRFVTARLAPAKPIAEQQVRELLARLDARAFREREEASRQLLALGEQAMPVLRQVLKEKPSLEVKARVERLMEELTSPPTPDQQRLLRAVAVLEWSGRTEADAHLRQLADGAASARLTEAAQAALKRRQAGG
jgi:hypothetical protein